MKYQETLLKENSKACPNLQSKQKIKSTEFEKISIDVFGPFKRIIQNWFKWKNVKIHCDLSFQWIFKNFVSYYSEEHMVSYYTTINKFYLI